MWLAIGDAVEHWARYAPQKTALRVGSRVYSYRALYLRAMAIASAVSQLNLTGRVGIGVEDKYEYLASIVALNLLGCPIVVLNPNVSKEALEVHLEDTSPSLILGSNAIINTVRSITEETIVTLNVTEILSLDEFKIPSRMNNSEWGVLFSSGSTGVSKAIVYDHSAMTSELLAWCLELGIRKDTFFFIGRPIFYTGGLVLTLATLLVGGGVFLVEHDDDQNFTKIWSIYQSLLEEVKPDFAFFVPNQIREFFLVAKEPFIGGPKILVMGAPITGEEKRKIYDFLKSPIIESWGNSEGLGTITDTEDVFIRPNSIGRPFLTEKLCIISEDFTECKPNQKGRLAGGEETMFVEYANRPEATNRVKQKNMILSDDIGFIDDEHYFYILGRDQESFVVNGNTIFLKDIDEQLSKISGVAEACAIATIVDTQTSFSALIVPTPQFSEDVFFTGTKSFLNISFAGYRTVDSMPRLPSGKLDRLSAMKYFEE